MLMPHLFSDLLTLERRAVDVSRIAETLRRDAENVEAMNGDASRLRDNLQQVLDALELLRLQRDAAATELRQTVDVSWAATMVRLPKSHLLCAEEKSDTGRCSLLNDEPGNVVPLETAPQP